jgi:hypothetical protein
VPIAKKWMVCGSINYALPKLLGVRKRKMKRKMREGISLITDLCIFAVGIPIVGLAYFVVDPLIAYYDGVKRRRKERKMRKSLMILLILLLSGYAGIAHVKAEEPITNELEVFCEGNIVLLQSLINDVARTNRYLCSMIHEDTKAFVPILFAQSKTENLSIMLWSTMVEMYHTADGKEVFSITLNVLDQYIELLKYDMLKARMFKDMIANSNRWSFRTKEQLALKTTAISLQAGYALLTHIREGLEELK